MNNEVEDVILSFIDKDKKVTKIPRKRKKLVCVLIYLADKFDSNIEYKESEVNDILDSWHTFNDYATLRRLLYDMGFLTRNNSCSMYKLCEKTLDLSDFEQWINGKHKEVPSEN